MRTAYPSATRADRSRLSRTSREPDIECRPLLLHGDGFAGHEGAVTAAWAHGVPVGDGEHRRGVVPGKGEVTEFLVGDRAVVEDGFGAVDGNLYGLVGYCRHGRYLLMQWPPP